MSTVICKQCGKENRSHFKFCLGCGAELTKDNVILKPEPTMPPTAVPPAPDPRPGSMGNMNMVANAPTMAATPGSELAEYLAQQGINVPGVNSSTSAPPPAAPPAAAPPVAPPPAAPPAAAPPVAPPAASDASGPFEEQPISSSAPITPPPVSAPATGPESSNELPFSENVGEFESADTVMADDMSSLNITPPAAAPAEPEMIKCPNCGADVPKGFKFCGSCGTPITETPAEPSVADALPATTIPEMPVIEESQPEPVAKLIVQRPDGSLEEVMDLMEGTTLVGRNVNEIFANDYYMSPEHANIIIEHGAIFVEDLNSLNGTFFRIKQEELLTDGSIFRIGTEVLRYRELPSPKPAEDGTMILGSPNLDAWGKLELIMGKGTAGAAYVLTGERIKIGRDEGDITFQDDGYVSGEHLELNRLDNETYLVDLNSSNGSYLKINGKKEIEPGTPILMGFQLYLVKLV